MDREGMALKGGLDGQTESGRSLSNGQETVPEVDASLTGVKTHVLAVTDEKNSSGEVIERRPPEQNMYGLFDQDAEGVIRVAGSNPVLDGHFEGIPVVPGVISKERLRGEQPLGMTVKTTFKNALFPHNRVQMEGHELVKAGTSEREKRVVLESATLKEMPDVSVSDNRAIFKDGDTLSGGKIDITAPGDFLPQRAPFLLVDEVMVSDPLRGYFEGKYLADSTKLSPIIPRLNGQVPQSVIEESGNQMAAAAFSAVVDLIQRRSREQGHVIPRDENKIPVLTLAESIVVHLDRAAVGEQLVCEGRIFQYDEEKQYGSAYMVVYAMEGEDKGRMIAKMMVSGKAVSKGTLLNMIKRAQRQEKTAN